MVKLQFVIFWQLQERLFNMANNYNYINCKEIETENRRTIEIKDK